MAQQALSTQPAPSIQVLQADNSGLLTVPGDAWLLKADFAPQGSDLLLTGPDGAQVLIRDFFSFDSPPDLVTDTGAMIPADLAVKLASPAAPGQFALLENGPFAEIAQAAESIGRVEATDGLVEAIRVDGTKVALAKGDDIFRGDTLVTAKGAAVGITFVDDTTFSLGEEGRMVIDEMVYDADAQEGQLSTNLVQGVFSFVSGQIAKTGPDAMTVTTPVATIGIRGTKVAGRAAQEGSDNTISLLPEPNPDGTQSVGELTVTNQGGTVTLSSVGATVQMRSAFQAPPPPVVFSQEQMQQNYGQTLTMQSTAAAAKASNDAAENAQEAEQAQAEAEQAGAEAEQAAAEAEAAKAEAEAAKAEAEAAGDPEALAAAEAAAAEAEAKAVEAEAKAAEAEAARAEAETKTAEAEKAQAEAEFAAQEMQAQTEAFAQFGGPVPDGPAEGDGPAQADGPADGEAPPEGGGDNPEGGDQQAGENDAINQAAEEATRQAIADGATLEEATAAGFEAAKEQALAEGATPEEIAAAEQAYNDALAAGASPEEAMRAAGEAAGEINPDGPDGTGGGDGTGIDGSFGGTGDSGGFAGDGGGFTGDGGGNGGDGGGFAGDGGGNGGDGGFEGGNIFGGGGDIFGGSDPFFGGGDPFFGGGGDPLLGGSGGDSFYDPYGGRNDTPDFSFTETGTDTYILDLGGPDPYYDDTQYNPDSVDDRTTSTFAENLIATTDDDDLLGGDGNTQFIMVQGSSLGGTDIADGGGGTDEIAFSGMNDLMGIYHGGSDVIVFSTSDSTIYGDITLTSVEQLYADDGVETFTDAASAGANTGTNGVRLDIAGSEAGYYGYIRAGSDNGDTISLADTDSVMNFGVLSHTIDDTKVMGSIIFGRGGSDTITGSVEGDTIFGGLGQDVINGGGSGTDDGDILIGGAGDDTFHMDTTSLSATAIIGGSDTDLVSYSSYASNLSFAVTSSSTAVGHDSIFDSISGVELLFGVSNATNTNSFTFTGDTTGTGLTSVYGGNMVDTFTFAANSTVSANIDAGSGNDIFYIGAGATFTGTSFTGGIGTDTINIDSTALSTAPVKVINGGNDADTLNISATADTTLTSSNLASITSIETWTMTSAYNYDVTLHDNNITSGQALSVYAVGSNSVTLDASAETNGYLTYTGSNNADDLTLNSSRLEGQTASLNGGTGTNTLTLMGTGDLSSTELSNVTNWQTWALSSDAAYTLTLNAGNVTAGSLTIDATAVTGATVTLDTTAEIAQTVNYTGGTGIGNVEVKQAMLSTAAGASTLTGGGGASDSLTIFGTGTLTQTDLSGISGWETWKLTGAADNMTMGDNNITSGQTLTINAAENTGAVTINGAAELDGNFTFTGTSDADNFTGGAGNDNITGGLGGDTLTGGGGGDTFIYTATNEGLDTITDFGWNAGATTNKLDFSALGMDNTSTNVGAADLVSFANADIDITGADVVVMDSGSSYTDAATALTALLTGITTTNNKDADNDFLFIWENSTSGNVVVSVVDDQTVNGLYSDAIVSDIITMSSTGISDAATYAASDDFIF